MVLANPIKGLHQGLASLARGLPFLSLNASRLCTLSLEGSNVRVVMSQGRNILSWMSMSFNPRLVQDGWVQDPPRLAEVISNALSKLGGYKGKVVAAFSGSRSVSRVISVPKARDINPDEVVPREARRLMGVVVENAYLFWCRLEPLEKEERYFVLATPKTGLKAFLETLRLSGLRPSYIDLRALALARAIGEESAIIANVEVDFLDVVVVKDYIPTVISNIPLEGNSNNPREVVSAISAELQQCISYHNDRSRPNLLGPDVPVYLGGGHPRLEDGLVQGLRDVIARPIAVPTPLVERPDDFPVQEFLVNAGLILQAA